MSNQSIGDIARSRRQGQAPAQSQGQPQAPKVNEEIDQKIDAFIRQNPKLFEYYNNLPKERLVRNAMLNRLNEAERKEKYQARQRSALEDWVNERPEIKARIVAQLDKVPAEKIPGAFVNLAKREQMRLGASLPPAAARQSVG